MRIEEYREREVEEGEKKEGRPPSSGSELLRGRSEIEREGEIVLREIRVRWPKGGRKGGWFR